MPVDGYRVWWVTNTLLLIILILIAINGFKTGWL